jgi:hypothetical protein
MEEFYEFTKKYIDSINFYFNLPLDDFKDYGDLSILDILLLNNIEIDFVYYGEVL